MGFFRTFGSHLGAGLADILLDRIAPPPPSLAQQILDEAPKVLAFVTMIANAVRVATRPAESKRPAPHVPHDVIGGTVVPSTIGLRAEDFPPFKKLGEFTCPRCGGHTWSWTGVNGVDENGTHIRRCSGRVPGGSDAYSVDCGFTWKATDDAKYFSSAEVGPAPEQACVAPDFDRSAERAMAVAGPLFSRRLRERLVEAVGDRRNEGELAEDAAIRLLGQADAFIAKQAAEIARQADVIKGYKFAVGCGEIQIHDTGTLCLGADGWSLRTDDGSKVTTVPVSAKEAAAFLSTSTGTLFEAHAIGSPMGRMNEYAKESAERSAIRNAIATSDAEVSCADYVKRQCPDGGN